MSRLPPDLSHHPQLHATVSKATGLPPSPATDDPANPFRTLEIRATVELTPDPDKALLPKFAARYKTPVEMLDIPGERVVATLTPVRVPATG